MKQLRTNFFLFLSVIVIIAACKPADIHLSKSEMRNIVEQQNKLLEECFIKSNIDGLALLYADSAKLSPNGNNFVFGRDSIKVFWSEDFKTSKVLEMKTTVLTVDGNAEVIYETGKADSKILYNDTIYLAHVKYINVWRKQTDGSYKLDIDFWNSDSPSMH
jgi:ketosteroid isomerase-like protein